MVVHHEHLFAEMNASGWGMPAKVETEKIALTNYYNIPPPPGLSPMARAPGAASVQHPFWPVSPTVSHSPSSSDQEERPTRTESGRVQRERKPCPKESRSRQQFSNEEEEQLLAFERSLGISRNPLGSTKKRADATTTLMMKNVPNRFTQQMVLKEIDRHGFSCKYDFFYLPVDFQSRSNMGYAFINFINSDEADRFTRIFEGLRLCQRTSKKTCTICPARVQGQKANIAAYRNSPVMSVPVQAYKPIILLDGEIQAFPEPEIPLAPIALRNQTN